MNRTKKEELLSQSLYQMMKIVCIHVCGPGHDLKLHPKRVILYRMSDTNFPNRIQTFLFFLSTLSTLSLPL